MRIKLIQNAIDIIRCKKRPKLVDEAPLEQYSVPYTEPLSTFKNLICLTGFGHSGSGALLDYLAEFDNATTFGYHDDCSKYVNTGVDEMDFIRCAGGVFDFERNFNYGNYFNDDFAVKLFLHSAQYFYRKGVLYTDKYYELTQEFVNNIVDIKVPTTYGQVGCYFLGFTDFWMKKYKNLKSPLLFDMVNKQYIYYLKNLSVSEYQKIAKNYIMSFLRTIESKDFLVLDQVLSTSRPDTERKLKYFDDFKCIGVYRDPRDVFATGVIKNEPWIPRDVEDFVKWYHHRGTPAYLAEEHPNKLMIRFEDLVLNYEETTAKVNKFIGIDAKNHVLKKQYFNPDVSAKNIGLYKTIEKDYDFEYIKNNLAEYCYE